MKNNEQESKTDSFTFTAAEMTRVLEWLDVFEYEYATSIDDGDPLVRRVKDYTSE